MKNMCEKNIVWKEGSFEEDSGHDTWPIISEHSRQAQARTSFIQFSYDMMYTLEVEPNSISSFWFERML